MKKIFRNMGMILATLCLLLSNSSYVLAAENDSALSESAFESKGNVYDSSGERLREIFSEERSSCTHIPCNHVTDTVWQHIHTGIRCDVYTANATWCKCCNTILKINSAWVYSYTHYGCNL